MNNKTPIGLWIIGHMPRVVEDCKVVVILYSGKWKLYNAKVNYSDPPEAKIYWDEVEKMYLIPNGNKCPCCGRIDNAI